MKILYNPVEGAPIKDIYYKDNKYFSQEDDDVWEAGTVREFDDEYTEIADFFMNLFGFLEEVTPERAAKIIEETKNTYPCKEPGCSFVTNIPVKLALHVKQHNREKELSKLGIRKFSGKLPTSEEEEDARERAFEKQNQMEALTVGEGLTKENIGRTTVMS